MDDTETPQPRKRGRPPGRTAYQEESRRQTRAAVLAAAAEVFATTPYVRATIDDIISAAKVSRATFYDHFDSKLTLALAIYDDISADWLAHFDTLAQIDTAAEGALERWVEKLAGLYIAHGYVTPLVEQLAIFEQAFRLRLIEDRDHLIDRLAGHGLPGFVAAMGEGRQAHLQRARLRLLLSSIDQVCGDIARSDMLSQADAGAYVAVLAGQLRDILTV
ncbi:MAG: TetR/AcrR family transcriptional regulator [Novosphingobium sp.]